MTWYLRSIDDQDVTNSICNAIDQKNCILLTGSIICAQANTDDGKHPPLYRELLKGIAEWCQRKNLIDSDALTDISEAINNGCLIESAAEIEDIFRGVPKSSGLKFEYGSLLQSCLREILLNREAKISQIHQQIAQIPFKLYFSIYYDTFIETAYANIKSKPLPSFDETSIGLAFDELKFQRPFIIKLHGDINNPSSISLSDRSYARLLSHAKTYQGYLHSLIAGSSILFIGCEETDIALNDLINNVPAFNCQNEHWLVVPTDQIPNLKAKRLFMEKRIQVIEYEPHDNHIELNGFLKALANSSTLVQHDSKKLEIRERIEYLETISTMSESKNPLKRSIKPRAFNKTSLRKTIDLHLKSEDLEIICADLGQILIDNNRINAEEEETVKWDHFEGPSKTVRIQRLIDYLNNKKFLSYFIDLIKEQYPEITFA